MKTKILFIAIALIGVSFRASAQNIIIQQNNSSGTPTARPAPKPVPKKSLGIGILRLSNEGYYFWVADHYIITGLYIKPRGKADYEDVNYCEWLKKETTNIPLDAGVYDVKVTYIEVEAFRRTTDSGDRVLGETTMKNLLIKTDYVTDLTFGRGSLTSGIPREM